MKAGIDISDIITATENFTSPVHVICIVTQNPHITIPNDWQINFRYGIKLVFFFIVTFLRVYSQCGFRIITGKHILIRFQLLQHMVTGVFSGLKGLVSVKIEGKWSFFAEEIIP